MSRVGKLAGVSEELWRLGGMQPSVNSMMYSCGSGLVGGQLSLWDREGIGE